MIYIPVLSWEYAIPVVVLTCYVLGDVILTPLHTGRGHVVQPTLHVHRVETENREHWIPKHPPTPFPHFNHLLMRDNKLAHCCFPSTTLSHLLEIHSLSSH